MSETTTPTEILQAARDLLTDPRRWTKGAAARFEDGNTCSAQHPQAHSFCSRGALIRVQPAGGYEAYHGAYRFLEKCVRPEVEGAEPVTAWNDYYQTTHAEVLAVFDKAIALASV